MSRSSPEIERATIIRLLRTANVTINDQWEGSTGYISESEADRLADAIAALKSELAPTAQQRIAAPGNDQLSKLWNAILENTKGDAFWIGEILLATLEREVGFNPVALTDTSTAAPAPTPDLPGMQGAVQYRRKDGGYGDRWITMAMFDGTLAAESYCSQQRKDDAWPFEYRVIGLPASPDTSTDPQVNEIAARSPGVPKATIRKLLDADPSTVCASGEGK